MKIIFTLLTFLTFLPLKISAQYTDNYCGNFNGTTSYAAIPNSAGANPTSAITLEAWVNPGSSSSTVCVIGKNFTSSYFLGIQGTTGRIIFYPKGNFFLRSRSSTSIPLNTWTHIAGVYDGTTTRIYLNGVLDTSTTAITGAVTTNTDSLFIGADRNSTVPAYFFNGLIDNVRIWGSARTNTQISQNRFLNLEIISPTGDFTNLRASYQLDNNLLNYGGTDLNVGYSRNVSFINLSEKAVNYLDYNSSLVFNGTTDGYSINGNSAFNATTAVTLEAWVKRDTTGAQPSVMNIVNKSGGTSRYNYALFMNSAGSIFFSINDGIFSVNTSAVLTSSQWTHVSATYNNTDGYAIIYMNGVYQTSTIFSGKPSIANDPDKLFIGSIGATSYAANRFKGQIDGVRIWNKLRTPAEIYDNMYRMVLETGCATLTFDKYTNCTRINNSILLGGGTFIGSTFLSSPHNNSAQTSSPVMNSGITGFPVTYTKSYKPFFVPNNHLPGIQDSIFIDATGRITRTRIYLLMSHQSVSDLEIHLISPTSESVRLFNHQGSSGNDIMTVFDDLADSVASSGLSTHGPGISPPFSPSIKPNQLLSSFNGINKQGWWKLKIIDNAAANAGYVHSWGLYFHYVPFNRTIMLTSLIQGFYNNMTDIMISDTMRASLRSGTPPFNMLDSSVSVLDYQGKGNFKFPNIGLGVPFYIVMNHRNSIETWSAGSNQFITDSLYYDFTASANQAYGANQILVDSGGSSFAIYNGNADQNDAINLNDIVLVYNDVSGFVTGYTSTDMTGDDNVNLADITVTYNNSNKFIQKIRP